MPRLKLVKPTSFARAFDQAALILITAILFVNAYRRLHLDTVDPYKCTALLTQGHWLDSPDRHPHFRPFYNWRVPGCLLHEYTAPEIASCNEDGQVLFVGDTGTRQVFWAAARKIEGRSMWVFDKQAERDTHGDLEFSTEGANLKFMWDPWLNSTALKEELRMFRDRNEPPAKQKDQASKMLSKAGAKSRRSVLIYVGGGLWHARHLGEEYLTHFQQSVDTVAAAASATKFGLEKMRAVGMDGLGDQIFFAPVIEPLFDRLSPSREVTITPHKIRAMNEYLKELSSRGLNVPWTYHTMTKKWPELVGESGIHVNARVASKMADIILNYRCNAKSVQQEGYPYDRTCCSAYQRPSWIQILAAFLLFPFSRLTFRMRHLKPGSTSFFAGRTPRMKAIWPIALVTYYSYFVDRTHLLEKSPKEFANIDFWVVLGIALVASMINTKKIPTPNISRGPRPRRRFPQYPFLPRGQSDELKGLMQIYLLVYKYTGASEVLNFYEVYQICVAAYLFFSGYGHTMYFLQTNDYTLQRVVRVMLRINTLPVILAVAMNRPYASYPFAPLVSIWILVIYATLRIGRRYNESFWYLVGKVVISALLVTVYIHTRGIIELTTACLRLFFRAEFDDKEWRFHLGIDKYVVLVGMTVAILRIRTASLLKTPRGQLPSIARMRLYAIIVHVFIVALALIVLSGFWVLTRRSPNRADYNWWMPYISWLPIVSFLVLRNMTHFLRSYYCVSFAWLGRISLELYLLSKHIWLAGDGKGLLKVGFRSDDGGFFSDRWRDLVILTPIFVWLAWKVHIATEDIIAWILCTKTAARPVGLGIEGLGEHRDEEHRGDVLLTPIGQTPRAPDIQNEKIGTSVSMMRRLVFVVVVIWLVSIFNT